MLESSIVAGDVESKMVWWLPDKAAGHAFPNKKWGCRISQLRTPVSSLSVKYHRPRISSFTLQKSSCHPSRSIQRLHSVLVAVALLCSDIHNFSQPSWLQRQRINE